MRGPGYPKGVPTPYVAHVHPYPTRFHGGIWTRPEFPLPQMQATSTVFLPPRDIEMIPDRAPEKRGYQGMGEVQYNVGDGIFRPGGYGGGVFDGNLAGAPPLTSKSVKGTGAFGALGDAASDQTNYPWLQVSAATKTLQQSTNVGLKANGFCPIAEDGKLGPGTCGARNRLAIVTGDDWQTPSTCQSFADPALASTGCGGGAVSVSKTVAPKAVQASMLSTGLSSTSKKVLGFAVGGLAAVGVVYYLKKRR